MPPANDMISKEIKETAGKLGFSACGIAPAQELSAESVHFHQWLEKGYHASMGYMDRNKEKRLNPQELNDWAKSVIVCLYNYYPDNKYQFSSTYKISKYAYGLDYHEVIKQKLRALLDEISIDKQAYKARVFVDSAPVLERAWAKRAGLGWTGKNACLINKEKGSFFFIGTIITSLELDYDELYDKDYCGNCTLCLNACPNKAIISPGVIDANKCISYLTIEHKGDFSDKEKTHLQDWIFGCDICQDICPWNRFSTPHNEPAFIPKPALLQLSDEDWQAMDETTFNQLFKNSPIERTGLNGLRRNLGNREQGTKNKE